MADLKEIYFTKIKDLNLKVDPFQLKAIQELQKIVDQLLKRRFFKRNFFSKSIYPDIKGLYIWGGVGRGKTFIMDIFYNEVPICKKKRQHFAHFMKNVHALLIRYQGKKNSIARAAYEIAKDNQLICFDEFFVEDIADAMILGNIFKELFKLGVILVATSNIQPQKLYLNGLQREFFLPTIDMLIKNVKIFNLDFGVDYRFELSSEYLNYMFPCNEANRKNFFDKFFLCNENFDKDFILKILGRAIKSAFVSHNDVCFDFKIICGEGRSASDYIEICKLYRQIFIYNLTNLNEFSEDVARRFISFIDECYDQNKKVVILADCDFKQIYKGKRLKLEFRRTVSRINDMQKSSFGCSND